MRNRYKNVNAKFYKDTAIFYNIAGFKVMLKKTP